MNTKSSLFLRIVFSLVLISLVLVTSASYFVFSMLVLVSVSPGTRCTDVIDCSLFPAISGIGLPI